MLSGSLEIDATPVVAFAERMRGLLARPMQDERVAGGFEQAARLYAEASQRRFEAASAGDGTWAPLKRPRPASKGQRILFVTGTLFRSLTPGGPSNVFEPIDNGWRYGTSVPWARFHQNGTSRLPQRPILVPPTQELLERCTAPIVAGFREAILSYASS